MANMVILVLDDIVLTPEDVLELCMAVAGALQSWKAASMS